MHNELNNKIREAFKKDFPLVADGTVELKAVAVVPGDAAMILFSQKEPGANPFGNMDSMDIARNIKKEIGVENIAIYPWSDDIATLIRTMFISIRFEIIRLDEKEKTIEIKVDEGSSQEIMDREGKILLTLAQELSGWKINVL